MISAFDIYQVLGELVELGFLRLQIGLHLLHLHTINTNHTNSQSPNMLSNDSKHRCNR